MEHIENADPGRVEVWRCTHSTYILDLKSKYRYDRDYRRGPVGSRFHENNKQQAVRDKQQQTSLHQLLNSSSKDEYCIDFQLQFEIELNVHHLSGKLLFY